MRAKIIIKFILMIIGVVLCRTVFASMMIARIITAGITLIVSTTLCCDIFRFLSNSDQQVEA